MKNFFKIRKIQTGRLAEILKKQINSGYFAAGKEGVRNLELAVRSLNLQRTP